MIEINPIVTIVLGRFQCPHDGHTDLIDAAVAKGDRTIVYVGSSFCSRSLDNPFTFEERRDMIAALYPKEVASGKLTIRPLRDVQYNDQLWLARFATDIRNQVGKTHTPVVIGMAKDEATKGCLDYLKNANLKVEYITQRRTLDATSIRAELFSDHSAPDKNPNITHFVQASTLAKLVEFHKTPEFQALKKEYWAIVKQRQINDEIARINGGFPPIYVAADVFAIWYDYWNKPHILLITRKGEIGKGKYALVGGYVNADETVLAAARREALEEAGNNLGKFTLGKIECFDEVNRSKRGRMITHVHRFDIHQDTPPEITAGDDAETVQWVPADKVASLQEKFFADHYHIICKLMPEVDFFNEFRN